MTPAPEILYRHPDGWTISYAENGLISSDGYLHFVIVPIGKPMLLAMAARLIEIANSKGHQ